MDNKIVTLYSVNVKAIGMALQAKKLNLMQKLMSIKAESLLDKIEQILDREMIVGYTVEGEPLTLEAYNNRLAKGEEQYRSGDFISHDDLGREMDNW